MSSRFKGLKFKSRCILLPCLFTYYPRTRRKTSVHWILKYQYYFTVLTYHNKTDCDVVCVFGYKPVFTCQTVCGLSGESYSTVSVWTHWCCISLYCMSIINGTSMFIFTFWNSIAARLVTASSCQCRAAHVCASLLEAKSHTKFH